MGFGVLIFGYALLLNVPYRGIDFPPDVLGYAVLFWSLHKLGQYGAKLRVAKYLTLPLTAVAAGKLAFQIVGSLGHSFENLLQWLAIADAVLLFPFYSFLLLGIRDLALSVALPKHARMAKRNLFIVAVFYLFTLFTNLYAQAMIPQMNGIEIIDLVSLQQLFGYLIRFLNLFLFLFCYMRICLEGDEDMPYKPSKLEQWMQNKRSKGDD